MDLKSLNLDTTKVIDILDYLRCYCGLADDNQLIIEIITYKEYTKARTRTKRKKNNITPFPKPTKIEHKHLKMLGLGKTLPGSILTKEDICNGTILLVRDCAGHLAPYQNPFEKERIKQKKLGGIIND